MEYKGRIVLENYKFEKLADGEGIFLNTCTRIVLMSISTRGKFEDPHCILNMSWEKVLEWGWLMGYTSKTSRFITRVNCNDPIYSCSSMSCKMNENNRLIHTVSWFHWSHVIYIWNVLEWLALMTSVTANFTSHHYLYLPSNLIG